MFLQSEKLEYCQLAPILKWIYRGEVKTKKNGWMFTCCLDPTPKGIYIEPKYGARVKQNWQTAPLNKNNSHSSKTCVPQVEMRRRVTKSLFSILICLTLSPSSSRAVRRAFPWGASRTRSSRSCCCCPRSGPRSGRIWEGMRPPPPRPPRPPAPRNRRHLPPSPRTE